MDSTGPVIAVLAGAILVPAAAFLVAGTFLTAGIFVIPVLFLGAVFYLWWSARKRAPRDTGAIENPPGSGAAPPGPRGGTYG